MHKTDLASQQYEMKEKQNSVSYSDWDVSKILYNVTM